MTADTTWRIRDYCDGKQKIRFHPTHEHERQSVMYCTKTELDTNRVSYRKLIARQHSSRSNGIYLVGLGPQAEEARLGSVV